ncbi:MAG: archaeal proteasome endopeptidase complex subunit beta [Conexivisphaerales archaeon]
MSSLDRISNIANNLKNVAQTGTTTLGIICQDAVVLATDSRVTMGNYIAHHKGKKLHLIDEHMGITIAGVVADAQNIIDVLRYYAKIYRVEHQKPMPISSAARLAANVFFNQRYYPYIVQSLIGGYDENGPGLYNVDLFGTLTNERFASTGSGSPVVYGILESGYRESMSLNEALRLAAKGVTYAMKRDSASGDSIDIAVIDSKGFRELNQQEKESLLRSL